MVEVLGFRMYKVYVDPDKKTKITEKYVKGVAKKKVYTELAFRAISKRLRKMASIKGIHVDFHYVYLNK